MRWKFWHRWAGNGDTKAALSALDRAMQAEHGTAFSLIRPQIEELLKYRGGKAATAMRQRGLSPEIIVLAAAKYVLDKELPSGRHHIYRGILSQSGIEL